MKNMNLQTLLKEKKTLILAKWSDAVFDSYPSDAARFFRTQKNQFANPVGSTISQGMAGLLDEVIDDMNLEKVTSFLDEIIRIRAVQDFTASQAVSFIFSLKKIIREEAGIEVANNSLFDELQVFDSRVDSLALLAFDVYMKCREKLYDIKANEVRRMTFRLLQQANLICEKPDVVSDQDIMNFINIQRREVPK